MLDDVTELVARLRLERPEAHRVTVGHGRDPGSVAAARRFAAQWEAAGGVVADVVDWPEQAASWLRQATRFTAAAPDAWVVLAPPEGWAGMRSRLHDNPAWDPSRTLTTPPAP
ncbi:hypothetical protein [Nonomuraea typhae]|uniref:hypothetical protein n=1 Tax=Nonomuraea typhae TaxID=2603600 RepID=UPI0012F7D200|nr:hypothetical protein [Nonomuraea typhae]